MSFCALERQVKTISSNLSLLYWILIAPFTGQFSEIAPIFRQIRYYRRARDTYGGADGIQRRCDARHASRSFSRASARNVAFPDLVMLTLLREMGPVLIAVIVIGRGCSAVAAGTGDNESVGRDRSASK